MAVKEAPGGGAPAARGVLGWWLAITGLVAVAVCATWLARTACQARAAVQEVAAGDWKAVKPALARLGGPDRAAGALALYLRLPERIAPNKLAAVRLLGHCGPEAVGPLRRMLHSPDEDLRREALRGLASTSGDTSAAAPELIPLLRDKDRYTREYAAMALAKASRPTPAILTALLAAVDDTEDRIRAEVVAALGALGRQSPAVLPALREALGDKRSEVRRAAIAGLEARADIEPRTALALGRAVQALLDSWRRSSWPGSSTDEEFDAILICRCLGRFGRAAEAARPALEPALEDANPDVRAEVALAFSRIGDHGKGCTWGRSTLEAMLRGDDRRGRWVAAEALAELGPAPGERTGEKLREALVAAGTDRRVAASIRRAIAAVGGGRAEAGADWSGPAAGEPEPEWCAELLDRLQHKANVEFVQAPGQECLQYVSGVLDVELICSDWSRSGGEGQVTFRGQEISLEEILKLVTTMNGTDYELCPEGIRVMDRPARSGACSE